MIRFPLSLFESVLKSGATSVDCFHSVSDGLGDIVIRLLAVGWQIAFLPMLAALAVFGMIRLIGLDGAALWAELVVIHVFRISTVLINDRCAGSIFLAYGGTAGFVGVSFPRATGQNGGGGQN